MIFRWNGMPWRSPCATPRSTPFAVLSYYVKRLFIHSAVCLTTGPQSLPKRVLHSVRSKASFLNLQYPLFSLRSSSSCLHLLSRLPITSILPSSFPSITCFRRHFLCKILYNNNNNNNNNTHTTVTVVRVT